MDYDGNETIESNEIDAFLKMFNNGNGISKFNDGGVTKPVPPAKTNN